MSGITLSNNVLTRFRINSSNFELLLAHGSPRSLQILFEPPRVALALRLLNLRLTNSPFQKFGAIPSHSYSSLVFWLVKPPFWMSSESVALSCFHICFPASVVRCIPSSATRHPAFGVLPPHCIYFILLDILSCLVSAVAILDLSACL